jgi:D-3-phosphoglycerate dehydrogenase
LGNKLKIVRTDQELECPFLDQALRDMGVDLMLLPDGIEENELARHTRDADLILMCYTPITAPVIENAVKLRGIVKYGVGIDAIDIETAKARKIPVVNIPEYVEETLQRCCEILEGRPALVKSSDSRLQGQPHCVIYA